MVEVAALALLAVLAVATAALARWSARRDRRLGRTPDGGAGGRGASDGSGSARVGESAPRRSRAWVILNPAKQQDVDAFRARLQEAARAGGWRRVHWRETSEQDPGTGQAVEAVRRGADLVVAAGGDGTIRAVAAGLARSGVPMGVIPAGTGNLFARNLRIPLESVRRSAEVAFGAKRRDVDLAWLRTAQRADPSPLPPEGALLRHALARAGIRRSFPVPPGDEDYAYLVIAGLGFDGETMAHTDPQLKKRVGWPAYVLSALSELGARRMRVELRLGDEDARESAAAQERLRARTVLFANCGELPYIRLVPDASVSDGLLDVVAVDTQAGLFGWASLAVQVVGQGLGLRAADFPASMGRISFRQTGRARVVADRPQVVQVDGDAIGSAREVEARIDAGALRVAVP